MQIDTTIQAAIQETRAHTHAISDAHPLDQMGNHIGVELNLVDMAHLLAVVRIAAAHPEIDATHQRFALVFICQCVTVTRQQRLPATVALYLAANPAPQTTYTLAAAGNSITVHRAEPPERAPPTTSMTSRIVITAIATSFTRRSYNEQNHLQQLGSCPVWVENQNSVSTRRHETLQRPSASRLQTRLQG